MSESNQELLLRVSPEGAPGKAFFKIEGVNAQCIDKEAANAHLKMHHRTARHIATSQHAHARASIKSLQL
jgi:hypothetical protein